MTPRENPFRAERIEAIRYRPMEGIAERLEALRYRAAIVGPEGTGKTTLLEELARRVSAKGLNAVMRKVDRERAVVDGIESLTVRDVLFLDSADLLSPWRWRVLKWQNRNCAGLVITSHRLGLLPTLVETRASDELLGQLQAELLPDDVRNILPDARELLLRHGGNIRHAFGECYDRYAALES